MSDAVNPAHYKEGFSNGAEPIDIAENLSFNKGSAMKYLARAGKKPGADEIQDLEKALWYINREIERIKRTVPTISIKPDLGLVPFEIPVYDTQFGTCS